MANNKRKKMQFDDRLESKAHRSLTKRQAKNKRHQTKTILNNFTGSMLDDDEYYDTMDDIENPEWSE